MKTVTADNKEDTMQHTYGLPIKEFNKACATIGLTLLALRDMFALSIRPLKVADSTLARAIYKHAKENNISIKSTSYSSVYKTLAESNLNNNIVYRVLYSLKIAARSYKNTRINENDRLLTLDTKGVIEYIKMTSNIIENDPTKGVKHIFDVANDLVNLGTNS